MTPAKGPALLIVDDEPGIRSALRRQLAKEYQVHMAANGFEAEEALLARRFSLVITDMRMPGRSGIEVLRIAKRLQPSCRLILLSAETPPDSAEGLMDAFVSKPWETDELRDLLVRLVSPPG